MALNKADLMQIFEEKTKGCSSQFLHDILIPTGRGGVPAARDYDLALAKIAAYVQQNPSKSLSKLNSSKDLLESLDILTQFRLKYYTPCLASRYDELRAPDQNQLFEDPDWRFTLKCNGVRTWVLTDGTNLKVFSRNYSDVDRSLLEYSSNILMDIRPSSKIYAIDCELMFDPGVDISDQLEELGLTTNSPLEACVALLHTYPESAKQIQQKYADKHHDSLFKFHLIAPLYFNGRNYMNRPLGDGFQVYDECVKYGQELGIPLVSIPCCTGSRAEKENFLETILDTGGEGCVAHFAKGAYCTSENRSKTSYIKIKRSIKTTGDGLGDTIDAFITGFKMGTKGTANEDLISAVEVTVHVIDNGKMFDHTIGVLPGIAKNIREDMTWYNADGAFPTVYTKSDGTTVPVSLNPTYKNLVVECTGQALSSKSQRLEHPRIIMWRPERSESTCIITKEWLQSQTTNAEGGITYKNTQLS